MTGRNRGGSGTLKVLELEAWYLRVTTSLTRSVSLHIDPRDQILFGLMPAEDLFQGGKAGRTG